MTSNSAEIPFGRFSLSPWRESLRRMAGRLPRNSAGRRMRSLLRRVVTVGSQEPYDIEVFPAVRARIYPNANLCEKRVFAAPQLFDWGERQALSRALETAQTSPFIFADLGANVGVYTLWMVSEARRLGRPLRALAIEPDPDTFARLETNVALSKADEVTSVKCAVGMREGHGQVVSHADNRGQHRVEQGQTAGGPHRVAIMPLHSLCREQGIERIDAMKVDIEGVDFDVLSAFFEQAPETLWPNWIVVEVGKQPHSPIIDLCQQYGYRLLERTRLNAILHRHVATERTN